MSSEEESDFDSTDEALEEEEVPDEKVCFILSSFYFMYVISNGQV